MDTQGFLVRSLLADRLVTEEDVRRAQERAAASNGNVVAALLGANVVTARQLAITVAKMTEYPFVELSAFEIDIRHAQRLPRSMSERLGAFPLFITETVATVAMQDPLNLQAMDQLRQVLKLDVDPVVCDADQLRALIDRAYSLAPAADLGHGTVAQDDSLTTGDEPIVAAVNQIIAGAAECAASDVHINPDESDLLLRYRVDGALRVQQGPAKAAHAGIVQRVKVLAQLDLTQTRKPQDGKFRFVHRGEPIDIRVSVIPTVHGENVVMRLLRPGRQIPAIRDLDMPAEITAAYEDAITRPHGMILVTGPTGSGKTTTLYAAISRINAPSRNIMTIEDPVEIRLPVIRQVQVNAEIGLTFASALRSILRQDPNVVLVGEIRDEETARIAVQAALTGHLVLSTLHTNDAVGSITRLRDFGLPSFAINQALLLAMAQRLCRRVCADCSAADIPETPLLQAYGIEAASIGGLRRGAGCAKCGNSGCRGRLGVYEVFRSTARTQAAIDGGAAPHELRQAAIADGTKFLWQDGLAKALRGLIPIDELARLRATTDEGVPVLRRAA